MPVSGRMSCSGPQKFSDFESYIMTGWVVYGRLVGHSYEWSSGLGFSSKTGHGWLASTESSVCLLLGSYFMSYGG